MVNGHVQLFTKAAARGEKAAVVALLASALPPGWVPFDGPVAVTCHLCTPFRRSEKKSIVRAGREVWRSSGCDLDNQWKGSIGDAGTVAQIWTSDSRIARLVLEKTWGPTGYWTLEVEPLDGEGGKEN